MRNATFCRIPARSDFDGVERTRLRPMVGISISSLSKEFRHRTGNKQVLAKVCLTVAPGEVVAVRGDNGTGKTTLLNIIAGIDDATEGSVSFMSTGYEPLRIGYAQQDYSASLLPWMDALDNISLPLRLRGVGKADRRQAAHELLAELGFSQLPHANFPHQLSGGQKQRVAIARALINRPQLLILDEPFANLDAHTVLDLQKTLSNVLQTYCITMIFVSHELDHCVFLADRVVLLHGTPAKVEHETAVPLERPRRRTLLLSDAYEQIRSEILAKEERLYASPEL
jgi:NitT/TauT family transport system ATP-binding protein